MWRGCNMLPNQGIRIFTPWPSNSEILIEFLLSLYSGKSSIGPDGQEISEVDCVEFPANHCPQWVWKQESWGICGFPILCILQLSGKEAPWSHKGRCCLHGQPPICTTLLAPSNMAPSRVMLTLAGSPWICSLGAAEVTSGKFICFHPTLTSK